MGAMQNNPQKRKKTAPKKTIKFGAQDVDEVSWKDVDQEGLHGLVEFIVGHGGGVMFNRSRDGGALGVRVYHDDLENKTLWFRDQDEFDELCQAVQNALN